MSAPAPGIVGSGAVGQALAARLAARLAGRPHRAVRLSHDIPASAAVLCKVADAI